MIQSFTTAGGAAFDDADVARSYACRPPYASAAIVALAGLPAARRRALDLGCGPGKLAGPLALHFAQVTALDPSGPMLAEARRLWPADNIRWLQASDAGAPLDEPYDLVTAGTSIHFMDHATLFPRLAHATGLFATVSGDHPPAPPWKAVWDEAMDLWLRRVGRTPDPAGFHAFGHRHEAWIDFLGRRAFAFTVSQPLDAFIRGQHSRATWARAAMGADLAQAFDADLERRLRPWTADGRLTYELVTEVVWGRPRSSPQPAATGEA
ncbi:class I SAM-dependent methyltransferase [Caulobacter sp. KR2-114]|uniref:class I SAM-dependent methyltransferase n=1 Tax=Caulobacter sp. KR2-114 TaxID=3400912 RepID=UPI003BFAE486